jgi:hypothetical protein
MISDVQSQTDVITASASRDRENRREDLETPGRAGTDFDAGLPAPVVVGREATGSRGWCLQLLGELGVTYRVGDQDARA